MVGVQGVMCEVLERLAGDPQRALPQRLDWLRQARDQYVRCLDLVAEDQRLGMLAALDERDNEGTKQGIARLDASIATLEAEIGAQRDATGNANGADAGDQAPAAAGRGPG